MILMHEHLTHLTKISNLLQEFCCVWNIYLHYSLENNYFFHVLVRLHIYSNVNGTVADVAGKV
jgi:hypothetical protein